MTLATDLVELIHSGYVNGRRVEGDGTTAAIAARIAAAVESPVLPVQVRFDPEFWPDAPPTLAYALEGSAGFDLVSAVTTSIPAGTQQLISTGIAVAVPAGCEGQVRPRSGLALKRRVSITNSPGTIDEGYTSCLQVLLRNDGDEAFDVVRGDRIAQFVIARVVRAQFEIVAKLAPTVRGTRGWGSTGR